jgi:hypothetical protein
MSENISEPFISGCLSVDVRNKEDFSLLHCVRNVEFIAVERSTFAFQVHKKGMYAS